MVLFVLLEIILFIALGLLVPMRLRFALRVDSFRPSFSVEAVFFYRLLRFRVRGFLACMPFGGTKLWVSVNGGKYKAMEPGLKEKKKEKQKPKTASGKLLRAVLNADSFDALLVRCKVGIAEDAYTTVLVCGALRALLEALFLVLPRLKRKEAAVTPDFNAPVFWLKVEGILTIHSTQIISAVFKSSPKGHAKNHKKGKQNVASH
ncbi:MAG: DUF2953 domain-containing protein [Eubacteriales bacterium]|nr:DUF2953 domain-containing protein [Eubacteriales bacterium]